jgi:hypothetical protein
MPKEHGNGVFVTLKFPAWAIVDSDLHEKEGLPYSLVFMSDKGGKVLSVFQKREVAERVIARLGVMGRETFPIKTDGELLQIVTWCKKVVQYVSFTTGKRKAETRIYSTKTIIDHITKLRKGT